MFKLAITLFSLLMLGLFIWSAYNLVKIYLLKKEEPPKKRKDSDNLDEYIRILKSKIEEAEVSSKKGIESSTFDLELYKKQLEQVENLKSKYFN